MKCLHIHNNCTFGWSSGLCGDSKVDDTVPVPVSMYRTSTYTGIEMPTICTDLNTGRTDHTGQFQALPSGTGRTDQYRKKPFFFFSFVIFEFL